MFEHTLGCYRTSTGRGNEALPHPDPAGQHRLRTKVTLGGMAVSHSLEENARQQSVWPGGRGHTHNSLHPQPSWGDHIRVFLVNLDRRDGESPEGQYRAACWLQTESERASITLLSSSLWVSIGVIVPVGSLWSSLQTWGISIKSSLFHHHHHCPFRHLRHPSARSFSSSWYSPHSSWPL